MAKEVKMETLKKAVQALNESGLIESPLLYTEGVKKADLAEAFISACENLPLDKTVPPEIADVYRGLKGIADLPEPSTAAPEVPKGSGELLAAALKAYDVDEKFVFSSTEYPKENRVCFVTHGGKKCNWKPGDQVEALTYIEQSGINPEAAKRKPIVGKKK